MEPSIWKSKRVRLLYPLFLGIFIPKAAWAVIGGTSLILPSNGEAALMKKVTVRLVYRKEGKLKTFCTGTAFSPNEALSGGHCFSSPKIQEALDIGAVFIEFYDPNSPGKVKRLQVGSMQRNQNEQSDFAYLRFKGESPVHQSIPLAYSDCDEGSPYYIAGFGLDENDSLPSTANYSTYRALSASERDRIKRPIAPKVKSQAPNWLVLKFQSGNTCNGDSGGPVFCLSKGQLALAAVSAAIFDNNPTPIDSSVPDIEACRASAFMSAGKISTIMKTLEDWRNPSASSSTPTSGNVEK